MALNFLNSGYFEGKVGIGTDDPSEKLEVSGNIKVSGSLNLAGDRIGTLSSDGLNGISLRVADANDGGNPDNFLLSLSNQGVGVLYAKNLQLGDGEGVENSTTVTIDSVNSKIILANGNVGIGTTSPNKKLEVSSSTDTTISIASSDTSLNAGQNIGILEFASNNETSLSQAYTPFSKIKGISETAVTGAGTVNGAITFETADANVFGEKMRIGSAGAIKFNAYGAGTLVTDASGNITASSGGGAGGPYLPLAGGTMTGNIDFGDSVRARFGDGDDLQIVFDGSNSYIHNVDNGDLYLRQTADDKDIIFECDNGSGGYTSYLRLDGSSTDAYFTNPGNVGIGTTSPDTKLTVENASGGPASATYSTTAANANLHLSAVGVPFYNHLFMGIGSATYAWIQAQHGNSAAQNLVLNPIGGDVGIGTTSPSFKLHVDSDVASGNVCFIHHDNASQSSGTVMRIKSDAGNNAGSALLSVENNSGSALYVRGDRNVGIGTTTPDALLHVRAATNVTGTIEVQGGKATVTAAGEINSELNFGSNDGSATGGIGGSIKSVTENTNGAYVGMSFYTAKQGRTPVLKEAMRINKDGNVGIGTDSPGYKLDVSGSSAAGFRLTTNGFTSLDLVSPRTSGYLGGLRFKQDIDTYQTGEFLGLHGGGFDWKTGDGSVSPSIKMSMLSNGNVGIGTTDPGEKLEVEGTVYATPITFSANQNAYALKIGASNDDAFDMGVKIKSTSGGVPYMSFRSASTEDVIVVRGSNVGIGDTSPAVKLQVSTNSPTNNVATLIGDGWIGSDAYHKQGGLLLISGTSQNSTQTGAGIAFQTRTTADNNYWKSSIIMDRDGAIRFTLGGAGTSAGSEDFTILSGGNVGIGTTDPEANLDVEDTTPRIRLTSSNTGSADEATVGAIDFYTSDASSEGQNVNAKIEGFSDDIYGRMGLRFFTGGEGAVTEKMRIAHGGNVGIGTTNPGAKLHVSGGSSIETTLIVGAEGSGSDKSARVFLNEGEGGVSNSKDYGFSLAYDGQGAQYGGLSANQFGILRHDNSAAGAAVMVMNRTNNNTTFTGNVGIGNTSPTGKLDVFRTATTFAVNRADTLSRAGLIIKSSGNFDSKISFSSGASSVQYIQATNNSASVGRDININPYGGNVITAGTMTATNFILSSDERLKENIKEVCDNRIKADWKTFELKTERGQKRYGVIAQELEKTNPEFVREDIQGFKSVAYIDLLIAKIAELEARLEKLEK